MISSISLQNFKSYKNAEMIFSPLTLFIGANASGKSKALECIRLLSWLARGQRLDDIEKNIQGVDTFLRGRTGDIFHDRTKSAIIDCHISCNCEGWNWLKLGIGLVNDRLLLVDEQIHNLDGVFLYQVQDEPEGYTDEVQVTYNNFKRGRNKPRIPCSNRQAIFYQLDTPARFSNGHEESQMLIPTVAKSFREALQSVIFLDPQPSLMRGYSYINDDKIKEDGSNLSSVLYSIWNSSNRLGNHSYKDYLLTFIQSLPEQDIKNIEFIKTERNDVMLRLIESFGHTDRTMDAPLLSDGTLRVLAVAGALLTAPQDSLVIIEEIDNGIHPSRASILMRNIHEISELRRLHVLLTSHNPALLDALPDENLGDVLCCYRDPDDGDSRIVQLKRIENYPE